MKHYDWQDSINPTEHKTLWVPQERDPRQYHFGVFTTTDLPMASAGSFYWLEDPHEFLIWLKLAETKLYDVDEEDLPDLVGAIDAGIAALENNGGNLTQDMIEPINNASQGYFCIDWWGNFEELSSGATEFALTVRDSFWELQLEGAGSELERQAPIAPEQMDEFLEFLAEYGV
jgi:hypothetical protein